MTNDNDARGALTERQQFEQWWNEHLEDAIHGRITSDAGLTAWDAWQAARKPAAGDGLTEVRAALVAARQFIKNGAALGYIRMPDADCPDPAHNTLPAIEAAIAILAAPRQPGEMGAGVWINGEPPHPWKEEWFIAETVHGDRVVLRALPEDFSYDYKTADETYIKAENIKRWMQFPDSQYVPASAQQDEREACRRCGGTGVVNDGEITGVGGVEFSNGPIQCVKDCPDCEQVQADAGAVAFWLSAQDAEFLRTTEQVSARVTAMRKGGGNRVAFYTRPAAESDKRDATEATDRAIDQAYCDGAKFGWNCCAEGARVRFQQEINARRDAIRESHAAMSREQSGGDRG